MQRHLKINPVIEKELRIKMRGWRSPALLAVYLAILGLVIFFGFFENIFDIGYSFRTFNPRTAYNVYNALASFQLVLLTLIVPAVTAGAISGERERQTLDLMLCTNFSPLSIIIGKIAVSIAQIMLLIVASMPILGTVFLFGGVRITDLLLLIAYYLATALMVASIGIFFSTLFKKTSVANILTYLTLMFLHFGTLVLFAFYVRVTMDPVNFTRPTFNEALAFLFANPMFGFSYLLEGPSGGGTILSLFTMVLSYGAGNAPVVPPWVANMIFDVVVAAVLIPLSARLLRRP